LYESYGGSSRGASRPSRGQLGTHVSLFVYWFDVLASEARLLYRLGVMLVDPTWGRN
jgi:hypothetical protein